MPIDNRQAAVIALGMFDGVHMGHRALLSCAAKTAGRLRCKSVAYTFADHPRALFGRPPKLLTTPEERKARLLDAGVDIVCMEPFDRVTASLSPKAFVDRLLSEYDIRAVVVGFNYTFGQGGQGNARMLRAYGQERGFDVHVIDPVVFLGETVSSTRIRELLESGELSKGNQMLVMPYTVSGTVMANRHIGTAIGFPTANIIPSREKVLPKAGVYVTTVVWENRRYGGVTNVGNNPTVSGRQVMVETHLLDFHGDLYGETLCVEFHARLRDEVRFDGLPSLVAQIGRDAASARAWLNTANLLGNR